MLERYRRWLKRERRLGEQTADLRLHWAAKFLIAQVEGGRLELNRIAPQAVTAFVLEMSRHYATSSMKPLTSGLRSLLRFLFAAGDIDRDLSPVVPSVAGWQLSGIPVGADDEAVTTLLASCDRSTAIGRRDFAVLLLMARLGLRAVEVARLRLEDIDWRGGGELTVRGKGGRIDRMPLPSDVGGALADWLRNGPGRWRSAMTTLREAVDRYLAIRRSLGYKLKVEGRMLGQFAAFCDTRGLDHVTVAAAVEWATTPAGADTSWWAARLTVIREFARFQAAFDAHTEVPPTALLPRTGDRCEPHLYSPAEITAMLQAARRFKNPLRRHH
ncbi:tyrosine-type recombinase/integrase [Nonomuraea sp. CA-143628]|uniref:tyrosine-type recombinase/integrase n=1 Tax=Nonomuraea sp. CA-143628 TaxID=3239997 RepID=UPI003D8EFD27